MFITTKYHLKNKYLLGTVPSSHESTYLLDREKKMRINDLLFCCERPITKQKHCMNGRDFIYESTNMIQRMILQKIIYSKIIGSIGIIRISLLLWQTIFPKTFRIYSVLH